MEAQIIEIDVRSGDVPSVRVNFTFGSIFNESREYKNCYAWYTNGFVYIVHYQDHPNMIPRAVFNADHIFVEHFGPHPHPPNQRRPAQQQKPQQPSYGPTSKMEAATVIEGRMAPQQPAGAPTGDTVALPVKETSAVLAGGPEAAAQLHGGRDVDEILDEHMKKFEELTTPQTGLPADPKDDAGPVTEEKSGSDQKMMETPSGRFLPFLPPVEETKKTSAEQTGSWQPSRGKGSHKRKAETRTKRALPGATALLTMAMFLALSFRHTS